MDWRCFRETEAGEWGRGLGGAPGRGWVGWGGGGGGAARAFVIVAVVAGWEDVDGTEPGGC